MNLNFLHIWLGVMLILGITAPLVRKILRKKALNEQHFFGVGFAVGGIISLGEALFKVIIDTELQKALDRDGTIGLCIGCGFGIYISLKEIYKLF